MRVAAVQYKPVGPKAETLPALVGLARRAAVDTDLVVLPELAATRYVFESAAEAEALAEPTRGQTFAALAPVAAEAGCWLVAGFVERAADRLFNSAVVIDPAGALAFTYRKTLLYELDHLWATPGDSGYATFATERGTFGVGICMDLNDDHFVAWCARAAPRALAFPTNWLLQDGPDARQYWAWRMLPTSSALVAANTWGAEGSTSFCGRSSILDGRTLLATAPETGDHVLRATLR